MDTGLLIQYLIIAVAVLVSAWVVLKKQFPGTVRKLRGALALSKNGCQLARPLNIASSRLLTHASTRPTSYGLTSPALPFCANG